jgi:hypothetical protein
MAAHGFDTHRAQPFLFLFICFLFVARKLFTSPAGRHDVAGPTIPTPCPLLLEPPTAHVHKRPMRLAATLALLVVLALAFTSAVEHVQLPVNGSAVTGTDLASADCGASTSELLTWGLDAGVIDAAQHSRLLTECQRRVASYEQQPGLPSPPLYAK